MNNKCIVNWHELKDFEILYIEDKTIKNLIEQGSEKAGSLSRLCTNINSMQFYNILNRNEGLSVKILKRLLYYLESDYNIINDKILEIRKGDKPSIKNPKFPINLSQPDIGYLSGHIVSDGCLYYDNSRKNLIRTKYCSDDEEGIKLFTETINKVFGKVYFNREIIRNCIQIRIGTGVVGETLRKAGVPVGKKYKLNEGLPWIVKEGDKEVKRQYLRAIFDDEGCVGKNKFPCITLSRNIHLNLSNNERNVLEKYVVPLMKSNSFPTGHITKRIQNRKLKEVLTNINQLELLNKILDSKPKILVEESRLLEKDFKIGNKVYVMSLQLTSNGSYSLQSCMIIQNKREVVKFYNVIGFSFTKKQKKLKEALINRKWT